MSNNKFNQTLEEAIQWCEENGINWQADFTPSAERVAKWEEQTRIAQETREFNEKVNVIARKQIDEFFANGTELTPIVDRQGNFLV